jgi:hypothetical protein
MSERFDVVLHSPAERLERAAWADRVLRVLEKLADLTGNRPFIGYRGELPVTVELKRSVIEELIEANVNREGGQLFTDLGSIFAVGLTLPGGDPDVDDVTASFRVANTAPQFTNGVTVLFNRGFTPAQARQFFETLIPIWKPDWGSIVSDENADARLDEDSLYGQRLHWYTYFGADRVRGLDFAALERDPQVVVRRHPDGSVEVLLGEQWQSAEKLLEAQRRLEPLFFRTAPGPAPR